MGDGSRRNRFEDNKMVTALEQNVNNYVILYINSWPGY